MYGLFGSVWYYLPAVAVMGARKVNMKQLLPSYFLPHSGKDIALRNFTYLWLYCIFLLFCYYANGRDDRSLFGTVC